MKTFSISQKLDGEVANYTIAGYIDEHAEFPMRVDFAKTVNIDVGQAQGMNSIGTKNWCLWMDAMKPPVAITIENCPPIFVKAFNTVLGALPKNMKVLSFYVPYVGPDGSEPRKDILFRLGHEFQENGKVEAPKIQDESGAELEIDAMPTYFSFLKR